MRTASTRSSNQVENLYQWVRSAILNGKIAAGETISQSQLAAQFGVSRTPLREALRMLQAEGLIVGELNQRMRVARLSPADIDSLYATRILLECFGLAMTMPRLSAGDIDRIEQALNHMNAHAWIGDRQAWEVHHSNFHGLLVMHASAVAGPVLTELIANFQLRAERYRRLYVNRDPKATARAIEDHTRIVSAVSAGSLPDAVRHLAEHYARTALAVLSNLAPDFAPTAVENSLAVVRSHGFDADHGGLLAAVAKVSAKPKACSTF
jgi:DNA-binding GntR family transcriptional regulator